MKWGWGQGTPCSNITYWTALSKKHEPQTFLVVQWLRIRPPKQGTQVRFPVWKDSTCLGTAKPLSRKYWAHKRSHGDEKPAHHNQKGAPDAATREPSCSSDELVHCNYGHQSQEEAAKCAHKETQAWATGPQTARPTGTTLQPLHVRGRPYSRTDTHTLTGSSLSRATRRARVRQGHPQLGDPP